MHSVVEIRSYVVNKGAEAEFEGLMRYASLPLLAAAGMDVVAFRRSADASNGFVLMRHYRSLTHLRESQDAFYSSDAWRLGPRTQVLACIENCISVVIEVDEPQLTALRRLQEYQ